MWYVYSWVYPKSMQLTWLNKGFWVRLNYKSLYHTLTAMIEDDMFDYMNTQDALLSIKRYKIYNKPQRQYDR